MIFGWEPSEHLAALLFRYRDRRPCANFQSAADRGPPPRYALPKLFSRGCGDFVTADVALQAGSKRGSEVGCIAEALITVSNAHDGERQIVADQLDIELRDKGF